MSSYQSIASAMPPSATATTPRSVLPRSLRDYLKRHIAGERSRRCVHGDITRSRASGNCGKDECFGLDRELHRESVERDRSSSFKPLAENAELLPNLCWIVN